MELKDFFDSYKNSKPLKFELVFYQVYTDKNGKEKPCSTFSTISEGDYEDIKFEIENSVRELTNSYFGMKVKEVRIKPYVESQKIDLAFMAEEVKKLKNTNAKKKIM